MGDRLLDIQIIWDTFSASYYSLPLMIALNIAFVIIAVSRRKRIKHSGPLLIFGVGALIQDMVALLGLGLVKETDALQQQDIYYAYSYISTLVFAVIYALIPYAFFLSLFTEKKVQRQIAIFRLLFVLLTLVLIIFLGLTSKFGLFLNNYGGIFIVFASLFAIVPPFYYIHYLFSAHPEDKIINDPAWWIACGFIIVNATIIPLFLFADYLVRIGISEPNLYTINYLSFSALFILFSRAFFCQPQMKEKIHVINE